jgi:hypothetical protein
MNQKRLEIASIMEKMGQPLCGKKLEKPVIAMAMMGNVLQLILMIDDAEVVDGLTFMLRMKEDGSREERIVFDTGTTKLPFEWALEGPNGAVRVRADNPSTFVIALVAAAHDVGLSLPNLCAMLVKTAPKFKEMCDLVKGEQE